MQNKREVLFTTLGRKDYDYWKSQIKENDKKIFKRINRMILEILQDPMARGTGKAELLKGNLSGCRSKRITDEHRLVYLLDNHKLYILSAYGHYDNKQRPIAKGVREIT